MKITWLDLHRDNNAAAPRGYGFAYTRYNELADVFYIFPFNWIAGYGLRLWRRVRHVRLSDVDNYIARQAERSRQEMYDRAYREATLKFSKRWDNIVHALVILSRPTLDMDDFINIQAELRRELAFIEIEDKAAELEEIIYAKPEKDIQTTDSTGAQVSD